MTSKYIVASIFILANIFGGSGRAGSDHKRLLEDLLKGIDLNERPVQNENDTLEVKIGLVIMNLIDLNVAEGYLTANINILKEWKDINLRWNSSDYDDIKYMSVPITKIWNPDIHYIGANPNFDPTYPMNVVVWENGTIMQNDPGIFRSPCSTDVTHYPFDHHKCTLQFRSWTHDGRKISLSLNKPFGEEVMMSRYAQNHFEREISGAHGVVNVSNDSCYPDVTFVMNSKRQGNGIFAKANFVLIIGALSTLIISFLLINSEQRITLGVVGFLVLLVGRNSINNELGGKASTLVSYFQAMALLIYLSIASNVLLLVVHNRNPLMHNIPIWLRKWVFDKILPYILLHRPVVKPESSLSTGSTNTSGVQGNYEEFVTDLHDLMHKIGGQESVSTIDWQYFAVVLDRLSFLFIIASITVFLIAFYCTFV